MRRKQRWLLTGLAVATALGAVPATTALAGATDAPAAVPGDRTVTLLSGDRVAVRDNGLQIIPGPGRAGMRFLQQRDGDHRLVVPVDAVAALGRGTLDRRLFDVTGLVAAGYDDRSRATLPLIVAQRGRAAPHLTGLTTTRALPGYRMTAATAPKNDTAALWKQVRSATDSKVWLDGKKQLSLDRSVPQIGAPAAWQAGLTGTGVKVAVLDSGYDPTHPDLTDRVVASRNFSADADIVDHVGHGTHVASTIAGSGAAAGGRFKGVAPGAQLMIGKVCEPIGCQESAMLDGMRWAAESGARVINMSLGGTDTPEVDPIEAAVDELTASTGALFVIAAGNSGPDTGTVGSPGSADAALTVGAVDRDGNLAGFSSRGPRVGDEAVKPDLTGPGVGIVAARAKGTGQDVPGVDPGYTAMSGTSMATPHVAGAAAIVAQQHPDWKAAQIKEALAGSTRPATDSVFDAGTGRVDVARAVRQNVTAGPAGLSFGLARWPHTDDKPQTKTVTYRNAGTTAVTLSLTLTVTGPGKTVPPGMFAAPKQVTVPANGTATADVTVNTAVSAPDGRYSAVLAATAGGDIQVRTALGVDREPESYDVRVTLLDRAGKPVDTPLLGFVRTDAVDNRDGSTVNGKATVRLPKGRWTTQVGIVDNDDASGGTPAATVAAVPDQLIDRDTTIVLDARKGRKVSVTVPDAGARLTTVSVDTGQVVGDYAAQSGVDGASGPTVDAVTDIYALPSATRNGRGFTFTVKTEWARPNGEGFDDSPYVYHAVYPVAGGVPADPTHRFIPAELATVKATMRASAPGQHGRLMSWPTVGGIEAGMFGVVPQTLPRTLTEYFSTTGGVRWTTRFTYSGPDGRETYDLNDRPRTYRGGRTYNSRWNYPVFGPSFPDHQVARFPFVGRRRNTITARVPMFADGVADRWGYDHDATGSAELYRDGVRVGTTPDPQRATFDVPAGDGGYRLVVNAKNSNATVTGEWTFRSSQTPQFPATALPVTAVRYLPTVDADGRVAASSTRIPLAVQAQVATSAVRSLTVDVSYDDGKTWQPTTVRRDATGWCATLARPGTPGTWVSLRSRLTATTAETAAQTVLRAYRLR